MARFRRNQDGDRSRMMVQSAQAARQLRALATQRAKKARRELLLVVPLTIAVLLAYHYRVQLFGVDEPIRIVAAFVITALGWWIARDVGRLVAPRFFSRVD